MKEKTLSQLFDHLQVYAKENINNPVIQETIKQCQKEFPNYQNQSNDKNGVTSSGNKQIGKSNKAI